MPNEIIQNGFFELEEVRDDNSIQIAFDYSIVTPEQADELQAIHKRVLIRHITTIYEDGMDLIKARDIKGLPYVKFIEWACAEFGWSKSTINRKMNTALRWGDFSPTVGLINDRALEVLTTKSVPESAREEAKQLLVSGQNIDRDSARKIRDAHQAREEAEKKAKDTQAQLGIFQAHSQLAQGKVDELNQQITVLEEKLRIVQTPEKVEVIPQKKLDEIKDLEGQIERLRRHSHNLSYENEKLATDLRNQRDANEARRKQEQYEFDIKDKWRKSTEALSSALHQFAVSIPSPIATQIFDAEEWTRYDRIEQALKQFHEAFSSIKSNRYSDQFVESAISSVPAIIEG